MGFTSKPVRVIEVPEPASEPLVAPEREQHRTEPTLYDHGLSRHLHQVQGAARIALYLRRRRTLLGQDRDPSRRHAVPARPTAGPLPARKPGGAVTNGSPAGRGHPGVRDPVA